MHGPCQSFAQTDKARKHRPLRAFVGTVGRCRKRAAAFIAGRGRRMRRARQKLPAVCAAGGGFRRDRVERCPDVAATLASTACACLNRGMLNRRPRFLIAVLLALASLAASARDDNAQIRSAIETYLKSQTAGMPGQASFIVNPVENSASRAPCPNLEVSLAPGARNIGRTTVLVRCRSEANWAIYVPVQIRLITEYLVTSRPLNQGQLIGESDLARNSGDLGDLPNGVLLDPAQAVGRVAAMSIPAGRPLQIELLRQPPVIQAGQSVKVISRGPSFEVSNEGRALTAAAEGKVVQVRLNSGQVVSGLARQGGIVEISF